VELFQAGGFLQAQRTRAGATDDLGDLASVPDLTVEVKNIDDLAVAIQRGMADLIREQVNHKTRWGVLFAKRRRRGWIAVMDGEAFVRLWASIYLRKE
jgi:hypothetical protein